MARWDKRTLQLSEAHGWHARPGCKIFVADRGVVRFDFPEDWVVIPEETGTIKFHDRPPPDDDCTLALSVLRLPPGDWGALTLTMLIEQVVAGDERPVTARGPIRPGWRIVVDDAAAH